MRQRKQHDLEVNIRGIPAEIIKFLEETGYLTAVWGMLLIYQYVKLI